MPYVGPAVSLSPHLLAGDPRAVLVMQPTQAGSRNNVLGWDTSHGQKPTSAAGQNCGHVLGAEAPGRQGATRAHSRSYVTEEQRSRPGWIGSQNMADILTGGTSPAWRLHLVRDDCDEPRR